MEQELGTQLPEEVRVVTVEESADTVYLVFQHLDGRRCGRRTFRSRARVGGWGLGNLPLKMQPTNRFLSPPVALRAVSAKNLPTEHKNSPVNRKP